MSHPPPPSRSLCHSYSFLFPPLPPFLNLFFSSSPIRKYASCLDADERNRRVKTLSKVKAHKEYACEVHLLKTRMNKRARSAGCKSILPAFCTFCYGIFFHYSSKYTPILMHMKYKHGIVNTILNIYGSYLS